MESGTVPVLVPAKKHPVSELTEICLRMKWSIPRFEDIPTQDDTFRMKVHVQDKEYTSAAPERTKKLAKLNVAKICVDAIWPYVNATMQRPKISNSSQEAATKKKGESINGSKFKRKKGKFDSSFQGNNSGPEENLSAANCELGLKLMQNMGWNPGEGLGRNNEGTLEPLRIDMKHDKKGLATKLELDGFTSKGKHPVMALIEICVKQNWGTPIFNVIPNPDPTCKTVLMKVCVNKQDYKPAVSSSSTKIARANAAAACLQALGFTTDECFLKAIDQPMEDSVMETQEKVDEIPIPPKMVGLPAQKSTESVAKLPVKMPIPPKMVGLPAQKSTESVAKLPVKMPPKSIIENILTDGKHPVMLLGELCMKKMWKDPEFKELDHGSRGFFLIEVRVNDVDYKPSAPSTSKKLSRKEAAKVCLKALGISTEACDAVVSTSKEKKSEDSTSSSTDVTPKVLAIDSSQGKHPVAALMELCAKSKWPKPTFSVYGDPDKLKQVLMMVVVNNKEYKSYEPTSTKKMAKASVAKICLQSLGILEIGEKTMLTAVGNKIISSKRNKKNANISRGYKSFDPQQKDPSNYSFQKPFNNTRKRPRKEDSYQFFNQEGENLVKYPKYDQPNSSWRNGADTYGWRKASFKNPNVDNKSYRQQKYDYQTNSFSNNYEMNKQWKNNSQNKFQQNNFQNYSNQNYSQNNFKDNTTQDNYSQGNFVENTATQNNIENNYSQGNFDNNATQTNVEANYSQENFKNSTTQDNYSQGNFGDSTTQDNYSQGNFGDNTTQSNFADNYSQGNFKQNATHNNFKMDDYPKNSFKEGYSQKDNNYSQNNVRGNYVQNTNYSKRNSRNNTNNENQFSPNERNTFQDCFNRQFMPPPPPPDPPTIFSNYESDSRSNTGGAIEYASQQTWVLRGSGTNQMAPPQNYT